MMDQSARQRTLSAGLAALAHLALLALFLTGPRLPLPRAVSPPLDVELVELPLIPPEVRPLPIKPPVGEEGGGASASRPPLEALDHTILEPAPPSIAVEPQPLPSVDDGIVRAPTNGPGSDVAIGNGIGTGSGSGNGSGSGARTVRSQGPLYVRPDWIELPNFWLGRFYPPQAKQQHMSGTAVLACEITVENKARNCRVHSETPAGYGFGAAALSASRRFKIRPPVLNGQPQPGTEVLIPLIFQLKFKGQ